MNGGDCCKGAADGFMTARFLPSLRASMASVLSLWSLTYVLSTLRSMALKCRMSCTSVQLPLVVTGLNARTFSNSVLFACCRTLFDTPGTEGRLYSLLLRLHVEAMTIFFEISTCY